MKSFRLFALLSVIALMASCVKQEQPEVEVGEGDDSEIVIYHGEYITSLNADIIQPDIVSVDEGKDGSAKVEIGVSDYKIAWENGDKIIMTNGTQCEIYEYDSSKGEFDTDGKGIERATRYWAFYPAELVDMNNPLSNKHTREVYITSGKSDHDFRGFKINFPSTQGYNGSVLRGVPMTAHYKVTEGSSYKPTLKFKVACAILRFQFNWTGNLTALKFQSNVYCSSKPGNDNYSAYIESDFSNYVFSDFAEDGNKSSKEITINLPTGGITSSDITQKQSFYFYLPAYTSQKIVDFPDGKNYTGGFSVSATVDGKVITKTKNADVYLYVNKFFGMKPFGTLFSGGFGTQAEPFLISKEQDIKDMVSYLNGSDYEQFKDKYYKQTCDITLTSALEAPICNSSSKPFRGVYYADEQQSISGLVVTGKTGDYAVGLFGYLDGDTGIVPKIQNITLINPQISTNETINNGIGALVGLLASNSTVDHCILAGGTISGGSSPAVGGLVGKLGGSTTSIKNCSVSGATISTDGSNANRVGGVVGHINSVASACKTKPSSVVGCTVDGTVSVSGNRQVGGVVGYAIGSTIINECISSAYVESTTTSESEVGTGGIIGATVQKGDNDYLILIKNCIYHSAGKGNNKLVTHMPIQGSSSSLQCGAGGIIGACLTSTDGISRIVVSNCFAKPNKIINVNGQDNPYLNSQSGLVGLIKSQLYNSASTLFIINSYSPMPVGDCVTRTSPTGDDITSTRNTCGSIYGFFWLERAPAVKFVYGNVSQMVLFGRDLTSPTTNGYNIATGIATTDFKGGSGTYTYNTAYGHTDDEFTVAAALSDHINEEQSLTGWPGGKFNVDGLSWSESSTYGGYLVPVGK